MSQREINEMEWTNTANWSNARLGFYFSKNDTRTWVPKRNPVTGWTLNLARSQGVYWMLGMIAAIPLSVALVSAMAVVFRVGH